MENKYYQKHKERLQNEARERYHNLSEEEKTKGEKEILKFCRRKKRKKGVSIIRNISRSYLNIEEIII